MTQTGGSYGKAHQTTEILSHASGRAEWHGPSQRARSSGQQDASLQRSEGKMTAIKAILLAALAFGSVCNASASADDNSRSRVAFFGFHLINTSLELNTAAEHIRIHQLDELFRQRVDASDRFKIIAIPPDVQKDVAAGPAISDCNGCGRDLAKRMDADWAAWGTVQKVSNLILNINVYMEDVQTGKPYFAKSVDIRGNTDESWRRGLDYMLRHYLLKEPGPLAATAPSQSSKATTGKERLGGKWMDEQRVDNCKVPIDKRGTRPRLDTCSKVPTE